MFYGDYPGDGAHTTRTVLVRDDGQVLLSVGSSCNVCEEADERRATILEIHGTAAAPGSSCVGCATPWA